MPSGRKNKKKRGSGDSNKAGNSGLPDSGLDSSASSSSNSFEGARGLASPTNEMAQTASSADKARVGRPAQTVTSPGGEVPAIDFGFSQALKVEKARSKPVKPHPAGEAGTPNLSVPFPQNESDYASTLSRVHNTTPSADVSASVEDAARQDRKTANNKGLPLARPSTLQAPSTSSMDQWSRHHGAKEEEGPLIEIQGPQFDAELAARLNQLDPRAQFPPQMAHLGASPPQMTQYEGSNKQGQGSGRKSRGSSRSSTPRHSDTSPLLPPNDQRGNFETPMEDPSPPPRMSHLLHGLLCISCCGLWIPCWIGACTGLCCEKPFQTAAQCCDDTKTSPTPQ